MENGKVYQIIDLAYFCLDLFNKSRTLAGIFDILTS